MRFVIKALLTEAHYCGMFSIFLTKDLYSLTMNRLFEYFILLTIVTNCVVLMIAKPLPNDDISRLNAKLVCKNFFSIAHHCSPFLTTASEEFSEFDVNCPFQAL